MWKILDREREMAKEERLDLTEIFDEHTVKIFEKYVDVDLILGME